jgi:hypothetical protein
MTSDPAREATDQELHVSLVRGDAVFRLQRRIGLIPATGLGVGRRALLLATVTWFPIMVWAVVQRRLLPGAVDEPLLQHFGVHVRCLVAIPLLVLGEAVAHGVTVRLVPYFVDSGLVREADRDAFREAVLGVVRLRDSARPWIMIAGLVIAWSYVSPVTIDVHEIVWAEETRPAATLGFGGWWYLFVVRPVYLALLVGWVWRLVLLFVLFRRIARVGLSIVPSHPDGAGGLAFLERMPTAFSMVVLAASTLLASRWAHDVVYHEVHVQTLRLPAIAFLVAMLVLFLAPLLLFLPTLAPAKRQALLDYGALVGEQGRLVRRRWIAREPIPDSDLLSAPEIGPVADAISLYEAVAKLRPAPIGRSAILAIALPAALPLLAVFAIEIPVKDLLLKLLSTIA